MKVKIIGFKVGKARPTYNKTLDATYFTVDTLPEKLGRYVQEALMKSDFLSIRRVE